MNFLIPFDGTPLAGGVDADPAALPADPGDGQVRLPVGRGPAGRGREIHLRTLQPLALHVVNSIFLGDYLTSEGQPGAADLAMIANAKGFTVEGADTEALLAAAGVAPAGRQRHGGRRAPASAPMTPAPMMLPLPTLAPPTVPGRALAAAGARIWCTSAAAARAPPSRPTPDRRASRVPHDADDA